MQHYAKHSTLNNFTVDMYKKILLILCSSVLYVHTCTHRYMHHLNKE